jgi:ankyrin repeat protein
MFAATPLISAIRYNRDSAVELILKFKPDVNPKDKNGNRFIEHPLIFPDNFVTERSIKIKKLLD